MKLVKQGSEIKIEDTNLGFMRIAIEKPKLSIFNFYKILGFFMEKSIELNCKLY